MKRKPLFLILLQLCLGIAIVHIGEAQVQRGDAFKQKRPIVSPNTNYHAAIGPSLQTKLTALSSSNQSVGVVIISFNTATGLAGIGDLDLPLTGLLARNGITAVGHRFETLGMISTALTGAQVNALAAEPEVRSLWANDKLHYFLHQARVLCGVDKLRADAGLHAQNGNRVIDGSLATGQFSVALIDSGIDTTDTDLPFDQATMALGTVPTTGKVIQNVQFTSADSGTGPVDFVELQVNDDSVGHGSHCAGIIGGTGGYSRVNAGATYPSAGQTEDFSGVAGRFTGSSNSDLIVPPNKFTTASGVKILGLGSGAGLFILDALGAFDYAVANRIKYNVRVTSNSYGSIGDYDPADPLSVAVQNAYNNGITNVFAAGNSGPGVNTISSTSKSPYVICVAAGTKEGGLASFSSRGRASDERTPGSIEEFDLPAITAPGTGREFDFDGPYDPAGTSPFVSGVSAPNPDPNGKKFYSDMISTESKLVGAAHGTNDQEFPAPYQDNYTMISGTSMATPFVAGACALLISVNPSLTPAQIKSILQNTATHMPGFQDYEVGAGYINVFAAVDSALNPAKPYGPFYTTNFNAVVTSTKLPPSVRPLEDDGSTLYPPSAPNPPTPDAALGEDFTMPYSPAPTPAPDYATAKTKATTYPSNNAYAFSVAPDAVTGKVPSILDVRIQFGQDSLAGEVGGNSLGLYLWAPDGTFYSSGLALPILDDPSRQVVVHNPMQGTWIAELRPVRGLAAIPITPPIGAALPDTTTGQIYRTNLFTQDPPDITELPQKAAIQFALTNRYLDIFPDGTFQPTAPVTKAVFGQALADNTPLRQTLASSTSKFPDTSGTFARVAEALSVPGSTLRDWDFTPDPTLPSGLSFLPSTSMSRVQAAISLVRALGLDKEALAISSKTVQVDYNNTPTNVIDANDGSIPASAKGYVQLALNRGILTYFVKHPPGGDVQIYFYPTKPLIRADLAVGLDAFRTIFSQGNSLSASELP